MLAGSVTRNFQLFLYIHVQVIPWNTLKYLIGEVMYGGRVIDDFDRRIVNTYMDEYMGDFLFDAFQPFHFYVDDTVDYYVPEDGPKETYQVISMITDSYHIISYRM